ncbi:TetR/AcrR family transcriptional regulator [Streptacidiphilus anmyonensis]|uniref:TetR/AcrR family transcriptional regulator n=1 Tax=Streptacidiphilus anmyonensis TaxID=405782 RepID=UPI0005A69451|nr:TetR/AcrR family transcriptional regulator [Streptacidiphilus anmyonensis]
MTESDAGTPRERYRAQVQEEIKAHAWEQIRASGASALSLNAIAKRMGLSGPALYRYYSGRDELITALVRDAYRSLADAVRLQAEAGADLAGLARTLRRWALEDPQRYFLVYGTPIPGYEAPPDTTSIAAEIMAVLLDAAAAAAAAAAAEDADGATVDAAVDDAASSSPIEAHLADHRAWAADHPASPAALRLALAFWTRLSGVLSLELAGHFTGMGFDPELLYAAEVQALTGS